MNTRLAVEAILQRSTRPQNGAGRKRVYASPGRRAAGRFLSAGADEAEEGVLASPAAMSTDNFIQEGLMEEAYSDHRQRLPYSPAQFVGRDRELALVADKVEHAQAGLRLRAPMINFWGVGGIGKTWLLQQIKHRYRFDPEHKLARPTFVLDYDFDGAAKEEINVIHALTSRLEAELAAQSLLQGERAELLQNAKEKTAVATSAFIELLLSLAEETTPLILFDTAEEIDTDQWPDLEEAFLEPLLENERILVITSGRRRAPWWRRVEVRRRAEPIGKCHVRPFDRQTIADQFAALDIPSAPVLANKLFDYTGGNPQLAYEISRSFLALTQADTMSLPPQTGAQFRQQVQAILQAYLADIWDQVPADLQTMINLLAPLRVYRTEELRAMMTRASYKPNEMTDIKLLRTLRRLEQETHFVWWDDGRNGYVTDRPARAILNQISRLKDEATFQETESYILEFYWRWARKYANSNISYVIEILFHQATLAGSKSETLPTLDSFEPTLKFIDGLLFDSKLTVQRRLQEDEELRSTLGEPAFTRLMSRLNALLGEDMGEHEHIQNAASQGGHT